MPDVDTDRKLRVRFPEKAKILFRPAPYKVLYGGRGGAKSHSVARASLILASQKKLFVLCAREIQRSIADSVHKLLAEQIEEMGMTHAYEIQGKAIINRETGSRFAFAGVRNNITAIKSMEAIDICWVEEATFVSEQSWTVLLPTIRRDAPHGPFGKGSEVWVTFNPELATDYTYKYWVLNPPVGTFVVNMSHGDNPWFPERLRQQMEDMRKRDFENYLTIFEGHVRRVLQGAIYARELEAAQSSRRISPSIGLDSMRPVHVGVDLGRADMTALWFFQQIGNMHYAIDYYGNFGFDWSHYLEQIQNRAGAGGHRYQIGTIYLPHDARNEHVAASKSIFRQTREAYPGEGRVVVVPRTPNVVNDINAVRALFGRLFFNETACADGLTALAHYRYEVDPQSREVSPKPLHDWASHAADALRTYVMGLRAVTEMRVLDHLPQPPTMDYGDEDRHGWMAL